MVRVKTSQDRPSDADAEGRFEGLWWDIRFHFEQGLGQGTLPKVALLFAVLVLLMLVGGTVAWLLPMTEFRRPGEALWWALLRLSDPGYLAEDDAPVLRMLSIALTVLGMAIFVGGLVAILTQALDQRMARLGLGLSHVRLSGHVAVLGWTNRTLELLTVVLEARPTQRITVLVEEITPEIHQALRDRLPRRLRRRVVLRTGDPERLSELARIRGSHAEVVLLPGGRSPGRDARAGDLRVLKVAATLDRTGPTAGPRPRLVAEVVDPNLLPVLRAAYPGTTQLIASDVLVGRSLALGILAPGLSPSLADILDVRAGCAFHALRRADLEGETLARASLRFPTGVLVGVVRGDRGQLFETAHDTVLTADERLLFLATIGAPLEPVEAPLPVAEEPLPLLAFPGEAGIRRVLVLGWNPVVRYLCRELCDREEVRFRVDVLSGVDAAERELFLATEEHGPVLHHLIGDPTSLDAWETLDPAEYACVVVLGGDEAHDLREADSRTIATVLILQDRLGSAGTRPHVIAELLDPANRTVLDGRGVEVVVTAELLADVLAGTVTHPELAGIFSSFIRGDLGRADVVSLAGLATGGETTFATIESSLRRQGVLCLGLQREARDFVPELVPDKREPLRLGPRDRALVFRPRQGS